MLVNIYLGYALVNVSQYVLYKNHGDVLTYELSGVGNEKFNIGKTTGVITLKQNLDREVRIY